jgi:hypothetical protein
MSGISIKLARFPSIESDAIYWLIAIPAKAPSLVKSKKFNEHQTWLLLWTQQICKIKLHNKVTHN